MNIKLHNRIVMSVLFGALLVLGLPLSVSGQVPSVLSDFNGDGISDLAIGVPLEDFAAGATDDGGVNVIYGSAAGLSAAGNQFWSQGSAGIAGGAETGDRFGSALAAGDFNGDGFADLAIGVPFEDFAAGATDDGGVNVIYGSAAGLAAAGNQFWSQDSAGIAGGAETGDRFGSVLATGDFNGDGFADLAIGVPLEDFAAGATNDGGVNVIYGSAAGLAAAGNGSVQDGGHRRRCRNGRSVRVGTAAANFGNTSHADLAIGVPLENFAAGATNDGGVNVIYGSAAGLVAAGNQFWSQDSAGIAGGAETGDQFGLALAAANFGNTSHADLAIGVPLENFAAGATNDGGVNVIYGSAAGLVAAGNQFWSQDSAGIAGGAETGDQFGSALAAANFGNTSHADLAIGVPFEDFAAGATNDGGVNVIYGSAAGLVAAGNQFWSQNSAGIAGGAETGDQFGSALAAANFGNTSHADLAIGVPFEDFAAGATNDGGVNVIYGSAAGLAAAGNQFWSQNSAGIAGGAETGDQFGSALAAANFGNTSHADLAIGVSLEDFAAGATNDGGVNVIYGSAAGLSAAGNQFWSQNSAGIAGGAENGDRFGLVISPKR